PTSVVMGRSGEIRIVEQNTGKVFISNHVPYGSFILVKEGDVVEKGQELVNWDPYNAVILAEFDGTIQYDALTEGITYREETDEQTGFREKHAGRRSLECRERHESKSWPHPSKDSACCGQDPRYHWWSTARSGTVRSA
nr:hypothetical protein [Tanacetum cinerariifolium]